ncbi:regulatory protein RecX [Pseudonocardia sichuanensis]
MAEGRSEHPAERADADADRVASLDGIAGGSAEPAGAPVARLGALGASAAARPAGTVAGPVPSEVSGGAAPPAEPPADRRGSGAAADLGRIGAVEQPAAPVAAFGADASPGDTEPGPVALFDPGALGADRPDVSVAEFGAAALRRRGRSAGGRGGGDRATDDARGEGASGGDRRVDRAGRGERGGPRRAGGGAGARGAGRSRARDATSELHTAEPRAGGSDAAGSHGAAPGAVAPDLEQADADGQPQLDAGDRRDGVRRGGRSRGRGGASRRPGGREELDPDADPVAVAREICLRMLTDRARTRQELAQALQRKGVPDDAAHAVLDRFDEVGLIDDAAFAGQWVRSRHNHRGLARRAIAMELRRKGVSEEDAGEALAEVDEESEAQRARELVDRKLRSLAVGTTEQRAAAGRRLVGMLARKGYGAGTAYRVVKEALAERGAESDELGDAEPPEE